MAGVAGIVANGRGIAARRMAFSAIHCFVLAFQQKSGQRVVKVFHGTGGPEGIFVVAIGAVSAEFAFMNILVALGAILRARPDAVLKNGRRADVHGVAPGAVSLPVLSFQRKPGFPVVKLVKSRQRMERLLGMTLLAIVAQVVVVRILVAGVAVSGRYPCKLLEGFSVPDFFFMAFATGYRFVLSGQCKGGLVVVKFCGRRKGGSGMALGTIAGQSILVHIGVARGAFPAKSEIRFRALFQVAVLHIFRFMALPAIDGFVRAGQLEARQVVVEFVFIKTDDVEVAAVVIAVANRTILSFCFLGGMKACAVVDPGFYLLVAGQTFFVGYLIAQHVAFGTIEHAFQIGMRFGELARRDLGFDLTRGEQEQEGNNMKTTDGQTLTVLKRMHLTVFLHGIAKTFCNFNAGFLQELGGQLSTGKNVHQFIVQNQVPFSFTG